MRAYNFLAEDSILLEYNRSKTAQAYGEKILGVAFKDPWLMQQLGIASVTPAVNAIKKDPSLGQELVDKILEILERGDPTPHKEYAQSIAKLYSNGESRAEDVVSTLSDYLTKFDKLKRRKKIQPPRNDFNRYRNLEDFYDIVDEYPDEEAETRPEEKKNATELYRDSKLIVLIPNDVEAACYYGQGTRWCTAGKNNNMYKHYTGATNSSPLYIIIPRQPAYPNEKYQFHFNSHQFMNELDQQIGDEGMEKLVKRFPELTKILQRPAEKYNISGLIGAEYKEIVKEVTPEIQKRIAEVITQYQDRIIQFGLKSVKEYGIVIPPAVEQAIIKEYPRYLQQCVTTLAKGKFWAAVMKSPGRERSADFIEAQLNKDQSLAEVAASSPIKSLLTQVTTRQGRSIPKESEAYIADILLRDPVFRICMTRIAQQYTAALQEHGHAQD